MSGRLIGLLLKHARPHAGTDLSDAELVDRFVAARDEAAFAALVHRHGPMVWAVCRNALAGEADAEDAFQATFLALVRQARRLRRRAALAAWLHGTAVRICLKARRAISRRLTREARAARPEAMSPRGDWFDDVAAAHAAIRRLPRREHEAFVLCVLEGLPQADAAHRLGLKPHSLSGLLSRARKRLHSQLTEQRSLVALAVAASCPAPVPACLVTHVLRLTHPAAVLSTSIRSLASITEVPMRKSLLIATLVLALGGGTLGTYLASRAFAQESSFAPRNPPTDDTTATLTRKLLNEYQGVRDKTPAGQPWEYKVLIRDATSAVENVLNEVGAAGWELSTATPVADSNRVMFVFKRSRGVRYDGVLDGGGRPTDPFKNPALGPKADAPSKTPDADPRAWYRRGQNLSTIQLRNTAATEVADILTKVFKNGRIVPDPRTNSLIIQGADDDLDSIKALIEKLDKPKSDPAPRTGAR
jgi:RNA polymerase sigma factor (sigma-70 family)